ncbi:multiple antibiotic resistance protein [Desulfobaculum xiamenense]|uniref:UPF0056 membrane protein n=1 Tax=Desulfobaculum xiamenense TaxID=995050 RepID=A0A846QKP2_9BACT|nr:MarC family protein [Desulfobaculum xiamenense]NJB67620.1 multiple antibiotic resistance protein [Desulfobaculum xiamenense]
MNNYELIRSIFELAFPLFLIMDPIGNGAVSLSLLRNYTPGRQRAIIVRECVFALMVVMLFQYLGEGLLGMLDIGQSTLRMAGGVILFVISMKMVFPPSEGETPESSATDPFIVPIAVPLIAGPSLLAAVMLYAHRPESSAILLPAIVVSWTATVVIMLLIPVLTRLLGRRGLRAAERLMGLILILMSFQMLEDGVRLFIQSL